MIFVKLFRQQIFLVLTAVGLDNAKALATVLVGSGLPTTATLSYSLVEEATVGSELPCL